jgi:hypothetical protein
MYDKNLEIVESQHLTKYCRWPWLNGSIFYAVMSKNITYKLNIG